MFTSVIVAAGVLLWQTTGGLPAVIRYAGKCVIAGTIVLAVADGLSALLRLAAGIGGIGLLPVHDAPHASRTLQEFWSRRWNLATARWLRQFCFRPLMRRGAGLALFATFAGSGALHVYLIAFAADAFSVGLWAAFSLVQPLLILAERQLHVRSWSVPAGRAWTLSLLLLASPLLNNPVFRLVHL